MVPDTPPQALTRPTGAEHSPPPAGRELARLARSDRAALSPKWTADNAPRDRSTSARETLAAEEGDQTRDYYADFVVRLLFAGGALALIVAALLMLTPAQAARRVGISPSLIYQLCAERRLPHYRIGGDGRRGKVMIDEKDLEAFLADCRVDRNVLDEDEPLKHIR